MKLNLKELVNNSIKGAIVLGTVVLTAYAEGLGSRPTLTSDQNTITLGWTPDDLAISEILKTARSYWYGSDKLKAATKIVEIANKPEQSAHTKALAIQALGKIRDSLNYASDKSKITELIVSITQ